MSESEFSSLLIDWGYLAIMLGVFIEGEIFLIMVGIATATTLFSYPLAILAATFAAILHDNGLFIFSKFMGKKIFEKKASWYYKAQKSLEILDKYESLAILSIRFLYGLRTITLLVVGLSKVNRIKFICLDSISSFVWSIIYISLGYLFGNTILRFIDNTDIKDWISHNKHLSIFILILVSSIIYLSYRILRSRSKRRIR
ncbi:DedA family protein [Francisella hispaniensis]|uniref:DedA family, membrane protein n=1 Tax=Francisella hispaniensis TaxID=622488 RepID=F4BJ79_9GAMM|nr:DedA family protein [Francisella hispaniensis]AEB28223.1 Putative DedA family, membrane protein [Francisella hispaniensis]